MKSIENCRVVSEKAVSKSGKPYNKLVLLLPDGKEIYLFGISPYSRAYLDLLFRDSDVEEHLGEYVSEWENKE